jgi:hypothetical protein
MNKPAALKTTSFSHVSSPVQPLSAATTMTPNPKCAIASAKDNPSAAGNSSPSTDGRVAVINSSKLAVNAVIQTKPATAHRPPQMAPRPIRAGAVSVPIIKMGSGLRNDKSLFDVFGMCLIHFEHNVARQVVLTGARMWKFRGLAFLPRLSPIRCYKRLKRGRCGVFQETQRSIV